MLSVKETALLLAAMSAPGVSAKSESVPELLLL